MSTFTATILKWNLKTNSKKNRIFLILLTIKKKVKLILHAKKRKLFEVGLKTKCVILMNDDVSTSCK